MGIKGLSRVIADSAPFAMKENPINTFFGRKVAIDASMSIYQFLIAVRSDGNMLTNEDGETTSHLMGTFYRTLRMVENGIKPVYVFDGKPPDMKSGELGKRKEKRKEAEEGMTEAIEIGNQENMEKFGKRTVRATKQHTEDCKKLLKLMGIPCVDAPCEAEAQCADLCKRGLVYGAASEDMDTLCFGSPLLLRHLTFSEARKMPIKEIDLEKVLEGLKMNMDQFIDMCILLGCDYCESIKGIGPKKAISLIQQYSNIETILENIDQTKYKVPEDWPYKKARELFKSPEVDSSITDLKWSKPDEEGVVQYLVKENGFE